MNIVSFSLGQLQENCYFLVKDKKCLIIDPGDSADFLLEEIQRRNLQLLGILATHGHVDHVMAVGEIQLSFKVPLYIFKEDLFLLKRLKETAEHFLKYDVNVIQPSIIQELQEGKLKIGEFEMEVMKTPGHTPGGCCFYFPDDQAIFTGDTLFKDAIGRSDFSYGRPEELKKSLDRLSKLPKETVVYSGHEEESTISYAFPEGNRHE